MHELCIFLASQTENADYVVCIQEKTSNESTRNNIIEKQGFTEVFKKMVVFKLNWFCCL